MPVLDDERLATLLAEAGDAIAIPEWGRRDILERARAGLAGPETVGENPGGDDADGPATAGESSGGGGGMTPTRQALATVRAHRFLAVAAGVILVAGVAVGLTVGRGSTSPGPTSVALAPSSVPLHRGAASVPSPAFAPSGTPTVESPNSGGAGVGGSTAVQGQPSTTAPTTGTPARGPSARIEETGSLDLVVHHGRVPSTVTSLGALATGAHGFVAQSQTSAAAASPGAAASGSITLEIPEPAFRSVLIRAEALGKGRHVSTRATNVTGTYVDLQAQITALEASRQQYLTIMTKATSISDILAVQTQLDALQAQIQVLQSQLQLLQSATTYATLTVAVHQPGPAHRPAAVTGIDRAWHNSVHGFVDAVDGLVSVVGPALFVLLCAGLVVLGGRLGWRRWQRHNL